MVDYFGVGAHLQKALQAYAPEDAEDAVGALASIRDEAPRLRDRHVRVVAVFAQAGIETFDLDEDIEASVDVLADEALRARFGVLLKQFLTTLDTCYRGRKPYRSSTTPSGSDLSKRWPAAATAMTGLAISMYRCTGRRSALIDEHVTALDIANKIPPVSITAPDFLAKVKGLSSDKAKVSEMEHALRFHIRKNFDEDPARYTKLSERLDEILKILT